MTTESTLRCCGLDEHRVRSARCFLRRGESASGVILTLVCLGTLGAAAVVFRPQMLFGDGDGNARSVERAHMPSHQALVDNIASMISGSEAVLGIRERPRGSQAIAAAATGSGGTESTRSEIVLWMEDARNPGWMDRSEVAVISHSRTLQTITLYVANPMYSQRGTIDPDLAAKREFCDAWRADRAVKGIVLATGVSDLRIERSGKPGAKVASLRISLTWASDSADGSDAASAQVDAIVFGSITAE